MPKIKFTATPKLPADYKHFDYKKDDEISAPQSWCNKWVSRGVAVFVADVVMGGPAPVVAKVADPVVAEPDAEVEPVTEAEQTTEPARRPRR